VKLVSPVVGWLEAVLLEKLVEKGEQHRIIVGQHEQVHRQQIRARLFIFVKSFLRDINIRYCKIRLQIQ
jgi:hypothetical protein